MAKSSLIVVAAAVVVLAATLMWRALAGMARSGREVRALVGGLSPEAIRDAVHARMAAAGRDPSAMMRESSECGDAYRALRSLLDATEHERIAFDRGEVRARVRDLLTCLQSQP